MKRHGYLYPKLCNTDNLRLAHQNARKGKTHYRDVKKVDGNPELYLRRIQKMLLTKKYVVGRYTIFKKRAECGKVREIYRLSYFPHRIIHHAILQIVEADLAADIHRRFVLLYQRSRYPSSYAENAAPHAPRKAGILSEIGCEKVLSVM